MTEKECGKKIDASKTNLQVCSIILAAVSLALKLSDFSQMLNLTKAFVTGFIVLAMSFLVIAIFLEADAVYNYSRDKNEFGDYFDKYGYKAMKAGLLFVLSIINYLALSMFPPLITIPEPWAEPLQAFVPLIITAVFYFGWRVFKCRKIRCKWYSI
jgi:hypothetical protein